MKVIHSIALLVGIYSSIWEISGVEAEEPICMVSHEARNHSCMKPLQEWGPNTPRPHGYHVDHTRVREPTRQSLSEFTVGGVNVAAFRYDDLEANKVNSKAPDDAEPYELYDTFDIGQNATGDEGWWDLLRYRQLMQRPEHSFYLDKVALKRWIPTIGIGQPRIFALNYASELTSSGSLEEETKKILEVLPKEKDYAAKPSHMALTSGIYLVSYDPDSGVTRLSDNATVVKEVAEIDPKPIARSLAEHLHKKPVSYASFTQHNVKPGFVVEERYSAFDCHTCPPLEFNVFTIWGRVWIAQINFVTERDSGGRHSAGFVHRNGTMVTGSHNQPFESKWLHWVDFPRVVDIAERLGAHKDMLRVDIFVGVRGGVHKPGATEAERLENVEYLMNELALQAATVFDDRDVREEGARLWIAGYKMGNYKTIPNDEIPQEFVETGRLSQPSKE